MVYLLETELSKNSSIFFSLNKIYGINKFQSFLICKKLGFALNLKVVKLSARQIKKLLNCIENLKLSLNNDLKKFNVLQHKNLISIKTYKGLRKLKGLPVRGQRTHTNARTASRVR